MIDEEYVNSELESDLDISNLLFKSIVVERKKYGHNECRFTCSENSIIHKWVEEALESELIIITHKRPYYPSYNDESRTFTYDIKLTKKGELYIEWLML